MICNVEINDGKLLAWLNYRSFITTQASFLFIKGKWRKQNGILKAKYFIIYKI